MSGRNGSIRRTKSDTVCRFCGKLLDRGMMARKFTVHGRTVYECIDHPFPREPEPKIITVMRQNNDSGIKLNLEKWSSVPLVGTLK